MNNNDFKQENTPRRLVTRSEFRKNIREITGQSRKNMKIQTILIWVILILLVIRTLVLFFNLAILNNKKYTELAASTHSEQYKIYPERGNIYAANGTEVAVSTFTYTVGVTPKVFGPNRFSEYSDDEVINQISEILEIDSKQFKQRLKDNEDAAYMVVKKNINPDMNDKLKAFINKARVTGIRQDANQARYYPMGDFASSIIGFANKQDQQLSGVSGIELAYNDILSGSPAYVYQEVDNYWNQPLPGTLKASVPEVKSQNLRLTIQEDLQLFVEEAVQYLHGATNPLNGSQILVLNAKTGGVLAYANNLSYNLNEPYSAPKSIDPENWDPLNNKEQLDFTTGTVWSNQAIRYPYEVGSVIKPFVLAMGLDEGAVKPGEQLSDDPITVDGWTMSSYDGRSRGMLTIEETIWDSRNPAFVRIAERMGISTFYSYINALGFKSITGVDLPNETLGLFHQNPQEIDMAVTAFGEQVTMTLMQEAQAYLTLANDGQLLVPHIIDAIVDKNNNIIKKYNPEVRRQVYSAESASYVRQTMIGVGRYGTAKASYVPGYEIAFKTGTSSRAINGSEDDNIFTLTAVAILPADNPEYIVLTTTHDVESPISNIPHITTGNVARYLIDRDNIQGNYKAYDYNHMFRPIYVRQAIGDTPRNVAYYNAFTGGKIVKDESTGWNDIIQSQYPLPGVQLSTDQEVWVSNKYGVLPEKYVELPDFTGMTAPEAKKLARSLNLNLSLQGYNRAGKVTSQYVINSDYAGGSEPGAKVREYTAITLYFEGTDAPGPREDNSLHYGYSDGSGGYYGY